MKKLSELIEDVSPVIEKQFQNIQRNLDKAVVKLKNIEAKFETSQSSKGSISIPIELAQDIRNRLCFLHESYYKDKIGADMIFRLNELIEKQR